MLQRAHVLVLAMVGCSDKQPATGDAAVGAPIDSLVVDGIDGRPTDTPADAAPDAPEVHEQDVAPDALTRRAWGAAAYALPRYRSTRRLPSSTSSRSRDARNVTMMLVGDMPRSISSTIAMAAV